LRLAAPVSGRYYLAVFEPNGWADKYVLSIGDKENWKPREFLQFPRIWWQVRMFAEQQRSTYLLLGAFLSLLLGSIAFLARRLLK